jgi:hypothetical protein
MAATASITISGYISNTPTGSRTIGPITKTSADANGQVQRLVLQSGENTITIPTVPAPNGCLIQLPATNTAITKFLGVTGETGFAIGKTTSQFITWDPTAVPASFILSSAATQTGLVTEITFF